MLVFGTAQHLKRQSEEVCVSYKGTKINTTTLYRYLGVETNSTLQTNFWQIMYTIKTKMFLGQHKGL